MILNYLTMGNNLRWTPEQLKKKGFVEKDGIYVPVKSLVNTGKVEKLPPLTNGLDNEIKWKEPGEQAYDGFTLNRTAIDFTPFEVPFFKSAIHTDIDKYGFPNVTPEQAKAIGDIQRRKLSKVNKSFGEAVVKAEQERAANPNKPYVHWEQPKGDTFRLPTGAYIDVLYRFDISPCPATRMTKRDKIFTDPNHPDPKKRQRPCVTRYFAFKREFIWLAQKNGFKLAETLRVLFIVPMPDSWSKKKRLAMDNQPHKQRGDVDNRAKSVMDAAGIEDGYVWDLRAIKVWGEKGQIIIF